MNLRPDWPAIVRHAWSVRFIVASIAFDVAECALYFAGPYLPWPQGTLLVIGTGCSIAALASRVIAQKNLASPENK